MQQRLLNTFPTVKNNGALYRVVLCCREGCEEKFLLYASAFPAPATKDVVRAAVDAGWICDVRGYAVCPTHKAESSHSMLSPAQKRAAYCRIMFENEAEHLREIQREKDYLNKLNTPKSRGKSRRKKMVDVDSMPRKPTPAQNRLIQDALDVNYDLDAQSYRPGWNDQKIAEKLNYPRIWVTTLRETLCGPENTAPDPQLYAEIDAFVEACGEGTSAALELAAKFEELEKQGSELRRRFGVGAPLARTVVAPAVDANVGIVRGPRLSLLDKENLMEAAKGVILERGEPLRITDIYAILKRKNFPFLAVNTQAAKQSIRRVLEEYGFEKSATQKKHRRYWPEGITRN